MKETRVLKGIVMRLRRKSFLVLSFILLCFAFSAGKFVAADEPLRVASKGSASSYASAYNGVTGTRSDPGTAILAQVKKGKWDEARRAARAQGDPLLLRLVEWLHARENSEALDYDRLRHTLSAYQDWPGLGGLILDVEQEMPGGLSDAEVVSWFSGHAPRTADGAMRYIDSLRALGRTGDAAAVAVKWWRTSLFSRAEQSLFLSRYRSFLSQEDHRARLERLLAAAHYTNARAIADLAGDGYADLAEARIALANGSAGVDALIARLPPWLQKDPGLTLERVRWRRTKGRIFDAMKLLHEMPEVSHLPSADAWWRERHIIARELLENRQHESAYLLVKNHRQTGGLPFAQAEWMAGWLALNFLNKPMEAFDHFERMFNAVSTPISKARAAYWAGLASEALGYESIARKWYQVAANRPATFYGQIAAGVIGGALEAVGGVGTVPATARPVPDMDARALFMSDSRVRLAGLLSGAGFYEEAGLFLQALAGRPVNGLPSGVARVLAAEYAAGIGQPGDALKIALDAQSNGVLMPEYIYPTILTIVRDIDAEWALVHALIRQESRFKTHVISRAGARGLMQLMPATAKGVARQEGLSYRQDWLTDRPAYNIRLGAAYIQEQLENFEGSYPLAIAAYNAGPGRVRDWLKRFGDPRTEDIRMIDWIEMIPIYETRNYVQRVMENIQVYRILLADLQRDRFDPLHLAFHFSPIPKK